MRINKRKKTKLARPGENGATVALILASAAALGMSFPIRLNGVFLRTLITLPLLFAVFPAVMFLDSSQITESAIRVVMNAARFRTYVHSFPYFAIRSLPELPRQVVPSSVELEVLVSLETFVTDLTDEPVPCH